VCLASQQTEVSLTIPPTDVRLPVVFCSASDFGIETQHSTFTVNTALAPISGQKGSRQLFIQPKLYSLLPLGQSLLTNLTRVVYFRLTLSNKPERNQ